TQPRRSGPACTKRVHKAAEAWSYFVLRQGIAPASGSPAMPAWAASDPCQAASNERCGQGMFIALLKSIVRDGSLRVIDAAGRTHKVGDESPPRAVIRLKSARLAYTLMRNPGLALGEAYMDGQLTVEEGSLYDFLALVARNLKVDRHG